MKTTVDLPDALVHEVKELAHREHVTMRELMIDGLRSELERRRSKVAAHGFVWHTWSADFVRPDLRPDEVIDFSYGDRG